MATTDKSEWRLLDTDTITHLAILPIGSSHMYQEVNGAGSGELKIPLDSAITAGITVGMFCQLTYRGSIRDGFFIENTKQVDADLGEGESRWLSVSGRGALALLDRAEVWCDSTGADTRDFTSKTKAYILKTLIDEAKARGALANLTYDFTASVDSSAVAWTDSENYSIPVGKKLLEVARQFAATGGFDFKLDLSSGTFTLHAYQAGVGTNKTSTTYFRIGEQCEEVGRDQRAGPDLVNAYLVKHQQGYSTVEDDTSITANGRAEGFLNLEQAQSSASAITYASAKLELTKNALESKTLKVYDGVAPRLFEDYVLGDTISLDKFGTVSTDRILGIKADFDGADFSHVVLDLNYLFQEEDVRLAQDLDALLADWNTAHDSNLLEVSEGLSIGGTNGLVNTIHTYGDYVYIGGGFSFVGSLATDYTAAFQLSTHTWIALTGISAAVIKIVDVSGTIYACTATKVYVLSGTAWSLVGTATAGNTLRCMTSDGTSLYVGGNLTQMDAVTINGKVAKRTAGVWTDLNANPIIYFAESMAFFNSVLYIGFGGATSSSLKYFSGGSYTNVMNLAGKYVFALKQVGSNLIIGSNDNNGGSASTMTIYAWDGVSIGPGIGSATVIGTITDFLPVVTGVGNGSCSITSYLTDIYFTGDFNTLDGVTGFNGIAKYSGGVWSILEGGVSTAAGDGVTTAEVVGNDVYAGGIFTSAFGVTTIDLALFVTDFESLVDHLANDPEYGFDMGAAIHAATAAAITDTGEIPFWDSVTKALRKITWANIKATLATAFKSGGTNAIKLDEWAAPTDVNTLDASISAHGLVVKAIAPAANVLNVVGIANGETAYTNKAIFDGTSPASIGTAAAGTSLVAAHRDHVHDGAYTALLSRPQFETNASEIFRCNSPGGTSAWTGTINGTPSGTSVTLTTSTGTKGSLKPGATTYLAKMRLYNLTRGNSALISDFNTTTNVCVLTANAPANWANGDSMTIASQTVTGAPVSYVDIEITSGPTGRTYMWMEINIISATAGDNMRLHPWEAFGGAKQKTAQALVANLNGMQNKPIKIISDVFSLAWTGTPTNIIINEDGYLE